MLPYRMSKNKQSPATGNTPEDPGNSSFSYHKRRCLVCKHPDCRAIEEEFLHWISPAHITEKYGLRDRTCIYRHAHATGLFHLRRANHRDALEYLIERNAEVKLTFSSVVCAVEACARINDQGKWVNPPQQIIVNRLASPGGSSDTFRSAQTVEEFLRSSNPQPASSHGRARSQHQTGLFWR